MHAMSLEPSPRKEPVAFDQLMEGLLLHAMKDRLDSEARRRLRALGVDVDRPLISAYPLAALLGTLKLCAKLRFPELPGDEARYQLGRKTLEGFGATSMGKALFGMARIWGARRMLHHMTRVLQTGVNHARAQAKDLLGGDVEVTVEVIAEYHAAIGAMPGLDPHFVRGIIAQLTEVCGAHVPVQVMGPVGAGGHSITYRIQLSLAAPAATAPVVLAPVK